MRGILLTFFLASAAVLGLGFYLDWFHLSARGDATSNRAQPTFDIDRAKIAQDANKARAQIGQAGKRVEEGAKNIAAKIGTAVKGDYRAKGELVKVDETDARLTIHTDDNKTLTVRTASATKIRRNGVDVNLDSLTEGDHVLVLYRDENGAKVAQSITVKPGTE